MDDYYASITVEHPVHDDLIVAELEAAESDDELCEPSLTHLFDLSDVVVAELRA